MLYHHCLQDTILWLCSHFDCYSTQLYLQFRDDTLSLKETEKETSRAFQYREDTLGRLGHHWNCGSLRHAVCLFLILASEHDSTVVVGLVATVFHPTQYAFTLMLHWLEALYSSCGSWLHNLSGHPFKSY